MTFEKVALSQTESGDLVKTLATPGFDVLMRLLRGERDRLCYEVGSTLAGMPMGKFSDPKEVSAEIHSSAVRARELTSAIRELETIATTDREAFVETRLIP